METNNNLEKTKEPKKEGFSFFKNKRREHSLILEREILQTKRVVKVTKGGRRFSFSSLVLVRDPQKKSLACVFSKGKEMGGLFKKALNKAKKKMVVFFVESTRTIDRPILVKYKATTLFFKPAPAGNGIKAGGVLNSFFKYLEIKDISAKIMGSRNKSNVIKAAFLALSELTGKKYVN